MAPLTSVRARAVACALALAVAGCGDGRGADPREEVREGSAGHVREGSAGSVREGESPRMGVVPRPREIPATSGVVSTEASPDPDDGFVPEPPVYGTCDRGEGGSGRTYMGREISEVMGHFGIGWLERPEREREERTDLLVEALGLRPDDEVADVGAGSGYFSFRIAPVVKDGTVFATDIQQEMLDVVMERALELDARNVEPVLGRIDDAGLAPSSIDVALMVDAYHEFSHPHEMMRTIRRALRPGGRVVLVEYRLEDPTVPIKLRHRMSEAQARLEMEAMGLEFVENVAVLPQQHVLVFRKPLATAGSTKAPAGTSPAARP